MSTDLDNSDNLATVPFRINVFTCSSILRLFLQSALLLGATHLLDIYFCNHVIVWEETKITFNFVETLLYIKTYVQ